MADVLDNVAQAVGLWWIGTCAAPTAKQDYSSHGSTDPCGGAVTLVDVLIGFRPSSTDGAATLIGIDTDNCVSYWHLTGMVAVSTFAEENYTTCQVGTPPFNFCVNTKALGNFAPHNVNITDGGSDTAPIDGHTIIPHSGYPVVAAIQTHTDGSNVHWSAFQAGEAAALTLAAAKSAVGVSAYNMCASTFDDINITVKCTS